MDLPSFIVSAGRGVGMAASKRGDLLSGRLSQGTRSMAGAGRERFRWIEEPTRFEIRFRVSNRFGEPLARARFDGVVTLVGGQKIEAHASTGRDGSGVVRFDLPVAHDQPIIMYRIDWADERGVVWSLVNHMRGPRYGPESGGPTPPQGDHRFVLTMRACPQQLPLPEIGPTTRQWLLQTQGARRVHEVYEDARDALIAGLPAASACMAGKTIEAAIHVRGRIKGWPVESWAKSRYTLGDYLRESVIEEDVSTAFSRHFFGTLKGTNFTRIEGAHDVAESTHVDEAKALLRVVTRLLDGWFGVHSEA